MIRIPLFYKTDEVSKDLCLTTRKDKFGNVFHCVEYPDNDTESGRNYAMFKNLSSALDFVQTNFRA